MIIIGYRIPLKLYNLLKKGVYIIKKIHYKNKWKKKFSHKSLSIASDTQRF